MKEVERPDNVLSIETRRIIQISSGNHMYGNQDYETVNALCNDGTVWQTHHNESMSWCDWYQLPKLPTIKESE